MTFSESRKKDVKKWRPGAKKSYITFDLFLGRPGFIYIPML